MTRQRKPLFDVLDALGDPVGDPIPVSLSPELVGLLSEQLYRPPSKAIEELVVNSFDAEAREGRVYLPEPGISEPFIVVYDNGVGMTYEGLSDLWKVGRRKERDVSLFERMQRKQIGKCGIGKLATYAVANQVTYVTKADDQHLALTVNYRDFASGGDAAVTKVALDVREVSLDSLWSEEGFRTAAEAIQVRMTELRDRSSWTIVILEDLKRRAGALSEGRLRRVLRTALPLNTGFSLTLNGILVESSKEDYDVVVEFHVGSLPEHRLDALGKKTGVRWMQEDESLVADVVPQGISGIVIVTRQSLIGKSSDLMRSEGFFVFVRGRLVNHEDVRFGPHELSHQTLNRFRAEVHADDLDDVLMANRESMEESDLYRHVQAVLNEVFNEARQRYEDWLEEKRKPNRDEREHKREWVSDRLVEYPIADALTRYSVDSRGSEPDDSRMYLQVDRGSDIGAVADSLYARTRQDRPYRYEYVARGRTAPMVAYDPVSGMFTINQDHELVAAYHEEPAARSLLENIATGEALLEVYLREADVAPHVVGEVLERRALLLRELAKAQVFALEALSQYLRDSGGSRMDLEVAVVAGARSLGFVTKHISGTGEPDGIARCKDFPDGEQMITLEAKSSQDTPPAKDIDLAALKLHVEEHAASGCLLVAPGYQGGPEGNSARSARDLRISCWTVEQFARVIGAAESRHITARQILDIGHRAFAPDDVSVAVDKLLAEPVWEHRVLYHAIVKALRDTDDVLEESKRSTVFLAVEIARTTSLERVQERDIRKAVMDLAGASHGGILLREDGTIVLNVDYDELERRVRSLTRNTGTPRRKGAFRDASGG